MVEAETEPLVLFGNPLEALAVVAFPPLAFSVFRIPPKTLAGTVEFFTFVAALLNESRVSCPPELEKMNQELVDT